MILQNCGVADNKNNIIQQRQYKKKKQVNSSSFVNGKIYIDKDLNQQHHFGLRVQYAAIEKCVEGPNIMHNFYFIKMRLPKQINKYGNTYFKGTVSQENWLN